MNTEDVGSSSSSSMTEPQSAGTKRSRKRTMSDQLGSVVVSEIDSLVQDLGKLSEDSSWAKFRTEFVQRRDAAVVALEDLRQFLIQPEGRNSIVGTGAPEELSYSDFEVLGLIGVGGFSTVEKVRYRKNGELYCLKIMDKEAIQRRRQLAHVANERNILVECDHHMVIKLYACFFDEKRLYFLLEYVPCGDLHRYMRRMGRLPEPLARFYAAEVVLVLRYLHNSSIAHRDIKPENLVLDAQGHIKLIDFGFSKRIKNLSFSICGTPEYMAPEVFLSKGHTRAVDWWALGVLIYEMLSGKSPFAGTDASPFHRIVSEKVSYPPGFSAEVIDLISRLLEHDHSMRLGNTRGGVAEIMAHPWFAPINWVQLDQRKISPFSLSS